jgi:hypothetical protein
VSESELEARVSVFTALVRRGARVRGQVCRGGVLKMRPIFSEIVGIGSTEIKNC